MVITLEETITETGGRVKYHTNGCGLGLWVRVRMPDDSKTKTIGQGKDKDASWLEKETETVETSVRMPAISKKGSNRFKI
jgi:hypothetical protein